MNARWQRTCIWAGPVTLLLFAIGYWFVAGLVPPISPGHNAAQVAARYAADHDRLRVGLTIAIFCSPFLFAWIAVLHTQLKTVEGDESPLATTVLLTGAMLVLFLFFPLMVLADAAFRTGEPPEITKAINDLGWLLFIAPAGPAVLLAVAMGAAMLSDTSPRPAFPRGVGYFNILMGMSFTGASLCWLFDSGPFAWNGVFPFWIPLVDFGLWVGVNTWAMLRVVNARAAAPASNQPMEEALVASSLRS
ncbi:MAG TPA: hypothetical protein VHU88_24065 [Sporichthyaceae bacterium]|jgi:hypothetical protein|nr:hypothetical protein [Sporichthyaceae bacterium]